MARIKINALCNVCTQEHSQAYIPRVGDPAPQITIPKFRVRMDVREAQGLRDCLTEAIDYIEGSGKPRTIWIATLETKHFTFRAVGDTRQQATDALDAGLREHIKTANVGTAIFWQVDDFELFNPDIGVCYRDSWPITPKE